LAARLLIGDETGKAVEKIPSRSRRIERRTMMKNQIGMDAGKVWKTLEAKGEMTTGALKKAVGLTPFALYAAIGWLAREDNVLVSRTGNQIKVALK
jgi:hypothetical protein